MYKEENLVRIAKRENNNKRNYLVVNRLQGKHIPTSPISALEMFDSLADILKNEYKSDNKNEKILLVGFAETATAIGARVAINLGYSYIQTTREIIDGAEYLFFTEAHSHATEQKLVKNDIDSVISDIDRIIFIEDEVTTGNTILDIVNIIEKTYGDRVKFSVASLLNGMNERSLEVYNNRKIRVHYLVKTNHDKYTEIAENFAGDGAFVEKNINNTDMGYNLIEMEKSINSRRLVDSISYQKSCDIIFDNLMRKIIFNKGEQVLVIGTEENMYPAIYIGAMLEKQNISVRTHSTTRSPIVVSREENYPVHTRYELSSLYDGNRKTFIYDLKKYDKVLIVTDAKGYNEKFIDDSGFKSLLNALKINGNENIYLISC